MIQRDDVILGRAQKEQQEANSSPWLRKAPLGLLDFAVAEQMRLQSSVSPAKTPYSLGMGVLSGKLGSLAGLHKSLRKVYTAFETTPWSGGLA